MNNDIKYNKPDVVVFDKLNKKIRINEIELTNQEDLQSPESFKK